MGKIDDESEYTYVRGHVRRIGAHRKAPDNEQFTETCAFCEGTGKEPDIAWEIKKCRVCKGEGLNVFFGNRVEYHKCSRCKGAGRILEDEIYYYTPCKLCGGKGLIKAEK
ncbi:MAG: zinc finger domain-containing protein [Dehalococcoidales bacterium]|nr:zinc finger domain-containing protein [Dehalococcoidales bacterium]